MDNGRLETPMASKSVDLSKKDKQVPAAFAKGGKGATNRMFKQQAADEARSGRIGKPQATATSHARAAKGGSVIPPKPSLARPAKGGVTR